jgi:hypothetical protein
MKETPLRRWRWLTRAGVLSIIVITLAWGASLRWHISSGGLRWWMTLDAGAFTANVAYGPGDYDSGRGPLSVIRRPLRPLHGWTWRPTYFRVWRSGDIGIVFPLWIPFVMGIAFTAFARRRARRASEGHCRRCGYDLTGNVSGVCPECGAVAARGAGDGVVPDSES